jgi:hypothetical protein
MNVCEDPTSVLLFPPDNDPLSPQVMQRVALFSRRQNTNDVMAREHDDEWHDDLGFTGASQGQFFTSRN